MVFDRQDKDRRASCRIPRALARHGGKQTVPNTTVSKEVRSHLVVKEGGSKFNPCKHRLSCKHSRDLCPSCSWKWSKPCASCDSGCYKHCKESEEKFCEKLKRPPYVCNGCKTRNSCCLRKKVYDAKAAQKEYEAT